MKVFTVAFFGHRYLDNPLMIAEKSEKFIKKLLAEKDYVRFLIGRNGEFDILVASVIRKVRKEYRDDNSELVLVLAYETAEYKNNAHTFEEYYDAIEISPESSQAHPKSAIQIRNREMIDRADLVICYAERKGGANMAVNYALKQNKAVINIAKMNINNMESSVQI